MHLVESFLPVWDNESRAFEVAKFKAVREELTKRFGGVTGFSRAPAHGTNKGGGEVQHDDIVIMEVTTRRDGRASSVRLGRDQNIRFELLDIARQRRELAADATTLDAPSVAEQHNMWSTAFIRLPCRRAVFSPKRRSLP
jgi:hypothetical protein